MGGSIIKSVPTELRLVMRRSSFMSKPEQLLLGHEIRKRDVRKNDFSVFNVRLKYTGEIDNAIWKRHK